MNYYSRQDVIKTIKEDLEKTDTSTLITIALILAKVEEDKKKDVNN